MTPQVLHQSVKSPMFMPYYLHFNNRSFSSTIKPGRRSSLGENNKLEKLEDIENEYKNKMDL